MAEPPPKKGRGFSALDEWASDVERRPEGTESAAAAQTASAEQPPRQTADSRRPEPYRPTATSPAGDGVRKLKNIVIGIGLWTGAILLLVIVFEVTTRPRKEAAPPRPVQVEQPAPEPPPRQAPPDARRQAPPPGMVWEDEQPRVPIATRRKAEIELDDSVTDDEEETVPPIGVGNLLDPAEVRYCVCESIRLEGMERDVDEHSESEVDAYNEAVADYNSRCVSFRYRRGVLERIQEAAEERRFTLELEGAQRLDLVR